jgi:hypothetical protein
MRQAAELIAELGGSTYLGDGFLMLMHFSLKDDPSDQKRTIAGAWGTAGRVLLKGGTGLLMVALVFFILSL